MMSLCEVGLVCHGCNYGLFEENEYSYIHTVFVFCEKNLLDDVENSILDNSCREDGLVLLGE